MEFYIEPGKYVAAVSGGVDSMVLLDLLVRLPDTEIVVAHFDHGIRPDSAKDRELVQQTAEQHGLAFEFAEGKLGAGASEEKARNARYEFLNSVREKHKAKAIVTAHHQDDLIETAVINMLRGTGRKGLTSMRSGLVIKRPLLDVTKQEILAYADKHSIRWHEDSTNSDTAYMRNYVRHIILPKLTVDQRHVLTNSLTELSQTNKKIEKEIVNYLQLNLSDTATIERGGFIVLPHDVAREAMASWLRLNGIRDFDRKTIERLVVAAKTKKPGQRVNIINKKWLAVGKDKLSLED